MNQSTLTVCLAVLVAVLSLAAEPVSAEDDVFFSPGLDKFSLIMFEDQWPCQGDRDFNDVVLRVNTVVTHDGPDVSQIALTVFPQAAGAGTVCSGLALHLPAAFVATAEATLFSVGDQSSGLGLPLSPWLNESELVYTVYDDVRDAFGGAGGFVNTDSAGPFLIAADPVRLVINFPDPATLDPADAPFDLFFYRCGDRSHQVHLPEYGGTDQMDASLFGSCDNGSTVDRHFVSNSGLPWMLFIPESSDAAWPTETTAIDSAFPSIINFAASGGESSTDWYENYDPSLVVLESQLPEPATLILMAAGLPVLLKRKRESR